MHFQICEVCVNGLYYTIWKLMTFLLCSCNTFSMTNIDIQGHIAYFWLRVYARSSPYFVLSASPCGWLLESSRNECNTLPSLSTLQMKFSQNSVKFYMIQITQYTTIWLCINGSIIVYGAWWSKCIWSSTLRLIKQDSTPFGSLWYLELQRP